MVGINESHKSVLVLLFLLPSGPEKPEIAVPSPWGQRSRGLPLNFCEDMSTVGQSCQQIKTSLLRRKPLERGFLFCEVPSSLPSMCVMEKNMQALNASSVPREVGGSLW